MASPAKQYAIIAGSGFRSFGADTEGTAATTMFGAPSGPIRKLGFDDHSVYLLPRHGDDLLIPPHAINYRANLKALADLNVDSVLAMNTIGVIKAGLHPGEIVVPDQVIDYTWGRAHSIWEGIGDIDHIDFTDPFSAGLREALLSAAATANIAVHDGGVYACLQGPRLESRAEVDRLERDGADYIGMTLMPEASLARELKMRYACLSLIVNYAAGRGEKPIHADIEASTMTAKMRAIKVLRAFFAAIEA